MAIRLRLIKNEQPVGQRFPRPFTDDPILDTSALGGIDAESSTGREDPIVRTPPARTDK